MAKQKNLAAVLSIIAGIIIIVAPQVLAWVIGLYLLISGALELFNK